MIVSYFNAGKVPDRETSGGNVRRRMAGMAPSAAAARWILAETNKNGEEPPQHPIYTRAARTEDIGAAPLLALRQDVVNHNYSGEEESSSRDPTRAAHSAITIWI